MRLTNGLLAAALLIGVSATATAQGTPPPPVPTPALAPADDLGYVHTHWLVSGSAGSNFGSTSSDVSTSKRRSWDIGAQAAYLWRGVVGPEFLANFTPSFGANGVSDNLNPHVNGYMANAIGAYPLGGKGQFQPYVSGGYGGMQMRFANIADTNVSSNQLTGAANIGTGLMAFVGRSKFGIRADARYYRGFQNNSSSTDVITVTDDNGIANTATDRLLSGLSFWQTNIGLAYQW